jgi:tellurite resistance protein TerC
MSKQFLLWSGFITFMITALIVDLKVFHRRSHEVKVKEALTWSAIWFSLALTFGLGIGVWMGSEKGLLFLTGYLIEASLSMDNLFVFLMIFAYFQVPAHLQHNVLFWGIFGAMVMRAAFILTGVTLIQHFHWTIYIFGAILFFTGIRMALNKGVEVHPEKNPILKFVRRFMPVTKDYHGDKFLLRRDGRVYATPLFIVLLVVESSDVMFAVDSIPAILAITVDPFIVYTSNAFAILGLRALYFALAATMRLFHHLHYGLSLILVFVGVKMLLSYAYKIPVAVVLPVVFGVLLISVIASIISPKKEDDAPVPDDQKPKPGESA